MKKFYTFTVLLLAYSMTYAQTQRLILLEHFTQASCGPCASYNPAMQALITQPANQDKIIAVKYQTSWPGVDPMNAHNPGEVQTRVNLYGVTGVPNSVIDGNVFNGSPVDWGQDTIDNRTVVTSPFEMFVSHSFDEGLDSIIVTVKIKATQAVSGANLLAHIAVIENHISFATAPGSNGEKDFYSVMKKMLPNANGTSIGSTFDINDSIEITQSWAMRNIYDLDEIAVVAWVQNSSTKEVHQAAKSPAATFTAQNTTEVALKSVIDFPNTSCDGNYETKAIIRNNGSATLTSLTLEYTVNNGTPTSINWSGNLPFMESTEIDLPISHTVGATDEIKVVVKNPNGVADPYNSNDSYTFQMKEAKEYQNYVFLTIQLDDKPAETTWQLIKNSDGSVVNSGGPYFAMSNKKIDKLLILEDKECYNFEIYDSKGDGFNAGSFYKLRAGNGTNMITQSSFENKAGLSFIADANLPLTLDTTGFMSIGEIDVKPIQVFPNPSNSTISIEFPNQLIGDIFISSVVGNEVLKIKNNSQQNYTIDVSELEKGIYFIRSRTANGNISVKFIKN